MSLSLARRFNDFSDIDQFLNAFVENKNEYQEDMKKQAPIFAGEFIIYVFKKSEYEYFHHSTSIEMTYMIRPQKELFIKTFNYTNCAYNPEIYVEN